MKLRYFCPLLTAVAFASSRADLTIEQDLQGAEPLHHVTVQIKGDKARVESGQQITTIVDSKNGEITTLMKDQKRFTRISGERMKAMAQMATQFAGVQPSTERPKLTPTGKTEKINGIETEEYAFDTPQVKASYWIAKDYPDGANILKQLQILTPQTLGASATAIPDYRDLPGIPLRTRITIAGQEIVTTIASIKEDPLPDSLFAVPAGYEEVKLPSFPAPGMKSSPPAQPPPQP